MTEIRPLKIKNKTVRYPLIQGGMGVGISLSSLAGTVARCGGVGIISTAQIGFRDPDFDHHPIECNLKAISSELKKARKIAPDGVIGFNIMVATKGYKQYVKEAVKAGADIIISGAGLPVDLVGYAREAAEESSDPEKIPALAPIVSSEKSATVILKIWDRRYHCMPDLIVIEGPLAGGHLGFSTEELHRLGADTAHTEDTYDEGSYDEEIKKIMAVVTVYEKKYECDIPVVIAGGIYTHEDVLKKLALGAAGVQVATRFVTTEECDAPKSYKEAYIKTAQKDIVITKSPVGMPGRAINNSFLKKTKEPDYRPDIRKCYQCLEHCDRTKIPYCITEALVNAARGNTEHALLFCGSDAWRAERIETVEEVIKELMESGRSSQS